MSEHTNTPTVVLVHGGFADASYLGAGDRGAAGARRAGARAGEPAEGAGSRLRVHRELRQPDRRAGAAGRPLVRGRRDLGRRGEHPERGRPGLRRCVLRSTRARAFGEIFAEFGDTPLVGAVRPGNYPLDDGETAVELTIAPELYKEAFAADLSEDEIRVLAVSQRPFAAIFEDRAEAAAWKNLPSWYVVATADNAIPPDAERHMARRDRRADPIEVDASHSIALSQPKAVAELIRTAVGVDVGGPERRLVTQAARSMPRAHVERGAARAKGGYRLS